MTEQFIKTTFLVKDHPIKDLSDKYKERYLYGIGEVLHALSPQNKRVKFAFDCLCQNIDGQLLEPAWNHTEKMNYAHKAQKLMRKGFHFFRVTDCFWWDVYHILYAANVIPGVANNTEKIKKALTRRSKNKAVSAFDYFYGNGEGNGLSKALLGISEEEKTFSAKPTRRFLVVGTMSAGKSTLINALVGKKVAKTKNTVTTTTITDFINKPFEDEITYSDSRDYKISTNAMLDKSSEPYISFKFKGAYSEDPIVFVDTPGIDYAYDESHRLITESALSKGDYDAAICVVNAPYMERDGESAMINMVLTKSKKKKIFVLNQLDRFDPDDDSIKESVEQFKNILKKKGASALVVPFSAKFADLLKRHDGTTDEQQLNNTEESELKLLSQQFNSEYFDLGYWGTGRTSKEDDLYARSGLTELETIITKR